MRFTHYVINSIVEKVAGGNSIFTTIANSVKTIVSGGRMLFPNIWSNSTFSKSYNISIKLSVFLVFLILQLIAL